MMDMNASFGAGKAGGAFDPISYALRPQVLLRFLCWLFSVIVFGCISSKGWDKDKCLYNKDNTACRFGAGLGLIGFLASIAFLVIEALYQNISNIKVRRRTVAFDVGFSGAWAGLYFICFVYLGVSWGKSGYPPYGEGINSMRSAIAFSFFSIGTWAGCAYFAYTRWLQGTDMSQFATGYEADDVVPGAGYSAYTGANEMNEPQFQEAPFTGGMDQNTIAPSVNYQAPAY